MSERRALLADYGVFLAQYKKWWLLPPLLILVALVALVWFTTSADVAGLVYNV